MDRGYVKLWRKTEDSQLFEFPKQFTLWCYLLIRASHNTHTYPDGTPVEPGELITSTDKLATRCGQSVRSIRTGLTNLELSGRITRTTNRRHTKVSILNWQKYQSNDKPTTSQRQTGDKLPTTTNNSNPNSNSKEETESSVMNTERYRELMKPRPEPPEPEPATRIDHQSAGLLAKWIHSTLQKASPQGPPLFEIEIISGLLKIKAETRYSWKQISSVIKWGASQEFWCPKLRKLQKPAFRRELPEWFEQMRSGMRREESGERGATEDKALAEKVENRRQRPQERGGELRKGSIDLSAVIGGNDD